MTLWLTYVIVAVICGIAGAAMLSRFGKGDEGFLIGFLLGPIGLIIAWTMRDNAKFDATARSVSPTGSGRDERECPFCAELILKKARVCKHCGRDVEPLPETTVRPPLPLDDLQSPNPEVRHRGADLLGERGAAAVDALPELERLAKSDPDRRVRTRAQWAVENIRRKSGRS